MTRVSQHPDSDQAGFALLIALLALVVPLLVVVGAASSAMRARLSRLQGEIALDNAMLAAESGIDYAIFRASTVYGLAPGAPLQRDLGDGMSFTVVPTFLGSDGIDNDGDAQTDESDEQIYQVLVIGRYGRELRRVVAYLGQQSSTNVATSPLVVGNGCSEIEVASTAQVDGHDWTMAGTPGNPANDAAGMVIEPPGTTTELAALLTPGSSSNVLGVGSAPSLGTTASALDLAALQLAVQNAANKVLTGGHYQNYAFGNGPGGSYFITYRAGDLSLRGNSQGAGVLFVTGRLRLEGTFRFDGIVFALGDVEVQGNATLYGVLIAGTAGKHIHLQGSSLVRYSAQATQAATALLPGKYVTFNGWQEISRS